MSPEEAEALRKEAEGAPVKQVGEPSIATVETDKETDGESEDSTLRAVDEVAKEVAQ